MDAAAVTDDPRFRVGREAHAIWTDLVNGGIPDRRQIDPLAFGPALLPMLAMLDVLQGGQDYRWRLFGTHHEQEFGANLTGTRLSELERLKTSATAFRRILDATVAAKAPVYFELTYLNSGQIHRHATGAMLPLTDGDPEIGVLLGATDWWRPPKSPPEPD